MLYIGQSLPHEPRDTSKRPNLFRDAPDTLRKSKTQKHTVTRLEHTIEQDITNTYKSTWRKSTGWTDVARLCVPPFLGSRLLIYFRGTWPEHAWWSSSRMARNACMFPLPWCTLRNLLCCACEVHDPGASSSTSNTRSGIE